MFEIVMHRELCQQIPLTFNLLSLVFPFSFQMALPFYGLLLLTMSWRALAKANSPLTFVTGVGSLLFVVSDALIAIHKFYAPLEHFQLLVMSTYYAAQFGITLTTAEIFTDERRKWKMEQMNKRARN